jgi:predicted metal-dependent phosphoesterase TrpH
MCTIPVARHFCRESYSEPEEVYFRLKQKGMDLVTVTDHDSIGAAETLGRHKDFFAGEEVTVTMPGGAEAHIAVYGIGERQHVEVQRRRDDLPSLLAYLNEQRLVFAVNHVFSGLTGRRALSDSEWFRRAFPLMETRNGAMLETANRQAARLAAQWEKPGVGGSDSHSLRGLASAWTEVPGVRTPREFLDGLRAGRGKACGASGGYGNLTLDILEIIGGLFRESPCSMLLAPAVLALPAVTLVNWSLEAAFSFRWRLKLERELLNSGSRLPVLQVSEETPA